MKKTNQQRKMILTTAVLALMFAVSPFQACGPGQLVRDGQQSSSSTFAEGEGGGMIPVSGQKAAMVTTSETIMPAMTSILRTPASVAAINSFNRHRTKITTTGKTDSVNAPMWLGLTDISGEFCNDTVKAEKLIATAADRKFFNMVDFNLGPASISETAKENVIRRLARAAWARNETSAELTLIKNAISANFTSSVKTDTDKAMMFTCAAMMAAVSTHVQ